MDPLTIAAIAGLVVLMLAFIAAYVWYVSSEIRSNTAGAPFVPMSRKLVAPILAMAEPRPSDVVYDLGCGDGRVLDAALRAGVSRVVGYDVGWFPLWLAHRRLRQWGDRAVLLRRDARMADVSDATIVYLYLFPKLVDRLATTLVNTLRPGTRIICPTFFIDTAKHPSFELLETRKMGNITTYLYRKI